MKKIIIIGAPGTGKSTLARLMHDITTLPVVHLDALFWKPGWIKTPKIARIALQQEIIQGEEWIIDGTYQSIVDMRLRAADAIIFLDMSRILCLWRVIKRHILYWRRSRPDLAKGCRERISWSYLNEVWNFSANDRKILIKKIYSLPNEKQIIRLTSSSEVSAFIKELRTKYKQL